MVPPVRTSVGPGLGLGGGFCACLAAHATPDDTAIKHGIMQHTALHTAASRNRICGNRRNRDGIVRSSLVLSHGLIKSARSTLTAVTAQCAVAFDTTNSLARSPTRPR